MRVVAQLAEFWKNFGPDKHAACGQRPAWHDSVRSLALAKFTGSLSMVTTRHPGSHSSTLPVEMLPVGEDPARQFCFNHFDFPPRGRGDAKIIEYEYLADDSLSLFGSSRVRSIFPPDRGVRVDPCYFFLFFLLEFISNKFNHQENSCKVFFLYMQAYAFRYDSKDDLSTIYRESKNNLKGKIFLAFHRTIYKYIPVYKYTEFRVY